MNKNWEIAGGMMRYTTHNEGEKVALSLRHIVAVSVRGNDVKITASQHTENVLLTNTRIASAVLYNEILEGIARLGE